MQSSKPTWSELAEALEPMVNKLLLARMEAEMDRARVDEIQAGLLAGHCYMSIRLGRGDDAPARITDPKQSYRMGDADAAAFHLACHQAYLADGYEVAPGYCPALIAEHKQVEAEWAVIRLAEQFFPGVTNNGLLRGTADKSGLEMRRQYLDLLIKAVVSRPGYKI